MTAPSMLMGLADAADGPGEHLRFRDVLVSPFTDLGDYPREYFHRGGPDWPAWAEQTVARHCIKGSPFDVEPLACEPEESTAEPLVWAGPIVPHFGHQVADYSMRLVPSLAMDPDVALAFATHPRWGWHSLEATPPFFREILGWAGVAPERVRLIDRPLRIEHLAVVAQSEQVEGPGPSAWHLDRMDELVDQRLGSTKHSGAVYVSRAAQAARFAGERAIEQAMAAAGVRVMRPETLRLADQLATYASADLLVFPEGSAIHGTQLLGRGLGDVVVIVRTPEDGSGHDTRVGEASVRPRARSLEYRSALKWVVRGLMPDGRPHQAIGMPVLDPATLIAQLRDVGLTLGEHWDRPAYETARDADILGWLERNLSHPLLRSAGSYAYIIESLKACGVGHLAAEAQRMMGSMRRESPRVLRSVAIEPHPRPAVVRQLERIAGAMKATTYLEIGPDAGLTVDAVPVGQRVAVGSHLAQDENAPTGAATRISVSVDEYLVTARPVEPFDLVFIAGPATFEECYRLLCGSLLLTHPRSSILIDQTCPLGPYATERDLERERELPAADASPWQGEAYKVVAAIHDLHPGLDYATIEATGGSRTLVWRGRGATRRESFGSIERIRRLGYVNLQAHPGLLRMTSLDEALMRLRSDGQGVAA